LPARPPGFHPEGLYAVPTGLHPSAFTVPALPCRALTMPSLRDWLRLCRCIVDRRAIVVVGGNVRRLGRSQNHSLDKSVRPQPRTSIARIGLDEDSFRRLSDLVLVSHQDDPRNSPPPLLESCLVESRKCMSKNSIESAAGGRIAFPCIAFRSERYIELSKSV
jgi:hypothetical protein